MELFLGSPPPMEALATRLDITNIDPFECLYHWVMVMSVAAFSYLYIYCQLRHKFTLNISKILPIPHKE